ncbi:YceI-like domain-containing protein [Lacibacter cauensis]|uniref:YceI-like domain-containing protein n=1 Tax=Lacibacter cauensis TaxID=510947 RepID=A0A562SWF1_9BACT|nr:YceI family protein [Lacibacter cauensis]TWI85314.1 YceI-like domain-containing protein [Lacibacter cauensis]
MKTILIVICATLLATITNAQDKYFTKSGKIYFDATSPKSPENVNAITKTAVCVLDTKTGNLQFSLLMKSFEFERALMQEHFNENYVESNKFPKAEFKGTITNNSNVNYAKDGVYNVKVSGNLTMHGETKTVETSGTVTVKNGKLIAVAEFAVTLADYKITVPQLVADKVAKTATIKVDCTLDVLK